MRANQFFRASDGPPKVAGSALLVALLTVALVAVLANQAFWQEWRSIELETADRSRLQLDWLLSGTHDWARARLRDDAQRSAAIDHAGEAWAQPVAPMSLATFLGGSTALKEGALVSQQLSDAQGKMNMLNLLEGQAVSAQWLQTFDKLFEVLKLPPEQLVTLAGNLRQTSAVLLPQQSAQLVWLGLAPSTVAALQPHVTWLPSRTPVNLNSASVEVLQSLLPSFKRADAERVVAQRQTKPLQSVSDAGINDLQSEGQYSVSSRFFELHTEISLGPVRAAENALLQRDGVNVRTLWRRRAVALDTLAVTP